jgi:hypothetical protein
MLIVTIPPKDVGASTRALCVLLILSDGLVLDPVIPPHTTWTSPLVDCSVEESQYGVGTIVGDHMYSCDEP